MRGWSSPVLRWRQAVPVRVLLLLGALGALGGCTEQLHESLAEKEANEMVAILRSQDIYATKQNKDKSLFAVSVPSDQFAIAVQTLRNNGYPRPKHANLGELFKTSGLVPTPMEEVVRYIHGMSEELTSTIGQIAGVTHVRVHIALSANAGGVGLTGKDKRSKASVLVEYNENKVQLGALIPRIRRLVGDSVPLLKADDVAVLAQEESKFQFISSDASKDDWIRVLGLFQVRRQDTGTVTAALGSLGALAAVLVLLTFGVAHLKRRRSS